MTSGGVDLSTVYMGLELKNPLVPSAGPLSRDLSTARELEDHGASALVMYSLFEEQIDHEARELAHYLEHGTESFAEALSYFPEREEYVRGPDEYLEHLRRLKSALDIPVIASLNGVSPGGWMEYASQMESAGADAIELNVYYVAADPGIDGRAVEARYVEVLEGVRGRVKVPVAIKLSPYFSSLPSMARRFDQAGANGLVLFNRFYQPDIDLESLAVFPNLQLSTSHDLRLPLRWISILHGRVSASLAASSGVDTAADVLKLLMAGADVTMVCSTLLRHGPRRLAEILAGVRAWLEEKEYRSIEELKGSMSQISSSDPAAFERANYMRALNSFEGP
jgi:dihydroorotate dehydrogenase (fumarate)